MNTVEYWKARAEDAEAVLHNLMSFLSVNGSWAELSAEEAEQRIRDGIDIMVRSAMKRAESAEAALKEAQEQEPVASPSLYVAFSDNGEHIRFWTRSKKAADRFMSSHNDWPVIEFFDSPQTVKESLTVKPAPSCTTCLNRGKVNGLSQESFCDGCIRQESRRTADYYRGAE